MKSGDKTQTLLEYLVELIMAQYPHLADFYEEMDITVDKGGQCKNVFSLVHLPSI